jgi:hypothetical protein
MTDERVMVRTTISFEGASFLLAQGTDVNDLKARIKAAAHAGGDFVDFVVVGNRTTSVFVNGVGRIVLGTETLPLEDHDTGDTDSPFRTFYDLI